VLAADLALLVLVIMTSASLHRDMCAHRVRERLATAGATCSIDCEALHAAVGLATGLSVTLATAAALGAYQLYTTEAREAAALDLATIKCVTPMDSPHVLATVHVECETPTTTMVTAV